MDLVEVADTSRSLRRQFSISEKKLVLSLVLEHPVLLDKQTKKGINDEKTAAWSDIHTQFVASNTCNGPCTKRQLRKLYSNMKFLSKYDPRKVQSIALDTTMMLQSQEAENQHSSSVLDEAAVVVVEQNEGERIANAVEADAYHAEETVILPESGPDGDTASGSETARPASLSSKGNLLNPDKMAEEEHKIKMKIYQEQLRSITEEHEGRMMLLTAKRELCQLKKRFFLNGLLTDDN